MATSMVIALLDNGAAANEMASGTEAKKLPYERYWTPATIHLGIYPRMNISQQLKATIDAVTAAVIRRFSTWCFLRTTLIVQHRLHEVLQFLVLALNMSLLSVPQVHTICSRDVISH